MVPAAEDITGADRVDQGEVIGLDGVGFRVGRTLRQRAAVQLIGDGIGDELPLRVKRQVIFDGDLCPVGIRRAGVFRRRSGYRVPALEFITHADEGVRRQVLRGAVINFFRVHAAFRPDAAFAVIGDEGDRVHIGIPLGIQRKVSRDSDLLTILIGGSAVIGCRVPVVKAVSRAFVSMRGELLFLALDEGLIRHGTGHALRGIGVKAHRISIPEEQPLVRVQTDAVLRVVAEEISLILSRKGMSGACREDAGAICHSDAD